VKDRISEANSVLAKTKSAADVCAGTLAHMKEMQRLRLEGAKVRNA
jgi:hypothetical protein